MKEGYICQASKRKPLFFESTDKKACRKPKFTTGPALEATGPIVIWEGNYKPDILISEWMVKFLKFLLIPL
jgi:hypothetical protein